AGVSPAGPLWAARLHRGQGTRGRGTQVAPAGDAGQVVRHPPRHPAVPAGGGRRRAHRAGRDGGLGQLPLTPVWPSGVSMVSWASWLAVGEPSPGITMTGVPTGAQSYM